MKDMHQQRQLNDRDPNFRKVHKERGGVKMFVSAQPFPNLYRGVQYWNNL